MHATIAPEACAATAARLRELAAEVRARAAARALPRTILKRLSARSPCLKKNCSPRSPPPRRKSCWSALKEHAARELAPYRSRMGAVQLRQVEHQFVQKQLLVHYSLPRLSLFYMSQQ